MKNLTTKNYIYQLSVQILNLIVPLITLPYITNVLMAEAYGFYTYSFTVISYIVLIGDFGIRIYGIRAIAYAKAISEQQVSKVFSAILLIRIFIVSVLTLISTICILVANTQNNTVYLLQLLNLLAVAFDISWFYQGIENFKKVAIRNAILKIVYLASVFLLVTNENDLEEYTLLVGSLACISNFSFFIGIKRFVTFITYKQLEFKDHIYNSLKLLVPQIAIGLYATVNKIMIGDLAAISEVGLYDVAYKITMIGMMVITTTGVVLMPKISGMLATNRHDDAKVLIGKSLEMLSLFGFGILAGFLAVSDNLVAAFFSTEFQGVSPVLKVLSVGVICWTLNNVTGSQILIPLKRERFITISVFAGLIVNILFNFLLIPQYFAVGAAISALITEIVVTGIQIKYSFDFFRTANYLSFLKYGVSAAVMYFTIFAISTLAIQIVLGVTVYFVALFLLKENTTIKLFDNAKEFFNSTIKKSDRMHN